MSLIPSLPSPQHALAASAVATINHLLAQEAWARDTLRRHADKVACIDVGQLGGHLRLCMRVARDGMLESARGSDAAAVTIHVKASDLPLILQNRERAFSYVRIDGDAEFANTISQLSKGLRWDAEHDLERFLGPIGAVRVAGGARSVLQGAASGGRRLAENVAEFLLEERQVLVRPASVAGFGDEVGRLRDDVERSAKRIARLEQKLAQQASAASAAALPAHPMQRTADARQAAAAQPAADAQSSADAQPARAAAAVPGAAPAIDPAVPGVPAAPAAAIPDAPLTVPAPAPARAALLSPAVRTIQPAPAGTGVPAAAAPPAPDAPSAAAADAPATAAAQPAADPTPPAESAAAAASSSALPDTNRDSR
ncbi:hypothetical protein HH212_05805 [Massilia forsythiae]|uniref:Ubiquinone biosynthesis accessory factor UbiJ n=1 Tax=Massilia forsythiae TaxID=2728020 RepID=A0A7Z2VUA5_9BURK|nr:SCP2 sterol-binding domain-containing protein [Massilia forsythiae]QJD99595.1 hypothetical protein HH212_05805 [Massilia forsythiae]